MKQVRLLKMFLNKTYIVTSV